MPEIAPSTGYGRGPKAAIAERLADEVFRLGGSMTPVSARRTVDELVAASARNLGVTDRTALRYLPADWAARTARELVVQQEAPRQEEQLASGFAQVASAQVGQLIRALSFSIQLQFRAAFAQNELNDPWPSMLGERADAIGDLAEACVISEGDVKQVPYSSLLATSRLLLKQVEDLPYIPSLPEHLSNQMDDVTKRLLADAQLAHRLSRN